MIKILKIGAFEMPVMAALEINQKYEPIGGEHIFRTINGRGVGQSTWRKTRVTTSGTGWIPPGLDEVDTRVQQAVACVVPKLLSANLGTRVATVPGTFRTDAGHAPYGLAIMANHQAVPVPVTRILNEVTVAAVAGAVAYKVGYYPLLNCILRRPNTSGPGNAWEIVAEEV